MSPDFPGVTIPYLWSRNTLARARRQRLAQLLPGEHLATYSQIGIGARSAESAYQLSTKSGRRASSSTQNPQIVSMGGKHVADELVRRNRLCPRRRKRPGVENFFEVAIATNHFRIAGLEVRLRQLGFEQHVAQLHVDFGAVDQARSSTARAPCIRTAACSASSTPSNANTRGSSADTTDTEDVHQQRVGAHRRVEFLPAAVAPGQAELRPACEPSPAACATPESPSIAA